MTGGFHWGVQLLAFSATYTKELLNAVESFMACPQRVLLSLDTPSLLGVRQFYALVQGSIPRQTSFPPQLSPLFFSPLTSRVVLGN